MIRSQISYRTLAAAAGLAMLAACSGTTEPTSAATDGPQVVGAWYQIFFETDGTEINARGRKIIDAIAEVAENDGQVRIEIVGKTDRIGTPAVNSLLSRHRAEAVRDALIAHSVQASRIDTNWVGETRQDVATADNVAERRNRVVDITVQHPY